MKAYFLAKTLLNHALQIEPVVFEIERPIIGVNERDMEFFAMQFKPESAKVGITGTACRCFLQVLVQDFLQGQVI